MKSFTLPPWRKKQINAKYRRKSSVVNRTVQDMERVIRTAVDNILSHYEKTGHYAEPTLNEMFNVSEEFYRRVITQAFHASKEEKQSSKGKKRMAKGPVGIPKSLKDLEQVFRDHRKWPAIMKRSKALTDRLRNSYLEKLRKKFKELVPKLESGELTPKEVKDQMMDRWYASKSRVETIFRTETTNYFGKTQVAFFEGDDEIIGFMFDSVKDQSRTNVCRSRHGLIYRPGTKMLRDNIPALHWNCRSHLIALANTEYNRKMLDDPDRDPAKKKVAPLPSGWRK